MLFLPVSRLAQALALLQILLVVRKWFRFFFCRGGRDNSCCGVELFMEFEGVGVVLFQGGGKQGDDVEEEGNREHGVGLCGFC